jgi:steroid delta-isomerase-like uncharacterized protein
MSIEDNKELARRLTKLLDHNDEKQIKEILSPDFISHFAGLPDALDREQYIQLNHMAKIAFNDLSRTVEDLIAEEDKVAVRITARGTHTGLFQGIPGTGKITKITGIAIRRIFDGRIVEEWVITDQLGLLQQLGILKMPLASKPEKIPFHRNDGKSHDDDWSD